MTAPYTPTMLTPSSPGQLSNKRGSNTGADAITPSFQYFNPRSTADQIGDIRVIATRPVRQGARNAPEVVWDSSWVAPPATNLFPILPAATGIKPTGVATYGGRVYICVAIPTGTYPPGQVCSAAINAGGNVAAWRLERGLQADFPEFLFGGGNALSGESICVINGYLYLGDQQRVYYAKIQGDGTLGVWSRSALPANVGAGSMISGYGDSTVAWVWFFANQASRDVYYAPVSLVDGSVGAWVATTALPAQRTASAIYYDPVGKKLYVIGGDDGVNAATTIYSASPTTSGATAGAISSWTTGGTGLPLARTLFGFAVVDTSPSASGTAYVLGGSTTPGGAGTATVYRLAVASMGSSAWTLDAQSITASKGWGAFVTPKHWVTADGDRPWIGAAGNGSTVVWVAHIKSDNSLAGVFTNGPSSGLTGALLGTNGAVTANQDGSQTVTFSFGAFGVAALVTTLDDGDQLELAIYVTDAQSGDVVLMPARTIIKIGQPPTISSAAVGAGGEPTASFKVSSGAGGGPPDTWRVTVGALFDSGIRRDQANSVQLLQAPMFANGVAQTATIAVTAKDTPMPGSLASASTTAGFTPAYTASAVPTTITATPSHAAGKITVGWTNPGGSTATSNRVYYRRNGTSTWYLLKTGIAAVIGSGQTIDVMDELALGVGYDFNVTAVGPGPGESAMGAAVTNVKIDQVVGGYSSMLHLAGQGTTYSAPLAVDGSPQFTTKLEVQTAEVFGQPVPLVRYGLFNYQSLELNNFVKDTATLRTLQALLAQVFTQGAGVYFRDGFGVMMLCGLQPELSEQQVTLARNVILRLVRIANRYAPSTSMGSATGYRQQVNGDLVALDSTEFAL